MTTLDQFMRARVMNILKSDSRSLLTVAFVIVVAGIAGNSSASENQQAAQKTVKGPGKATGADRPLVYVPPRRGAPATRVGGGTRGDSDTPALYVLAPEHTGLTLKSQPILYWYVSETANARFEFALITGKELKTVIESELPAGSRLGIQRLSLQDHGVNLVPGVLYQWSVALVNDPENRSADIVASGTIERARADAFPALGATPPKTEDAAYNYAAAGLWYDAFSAVSALLARYPSEKHHIEQRAALLEQVGLQEVADSERLRMP